MKLARKLTLALVVAILAVMGGYAWLLSHHAITLYEGDVRPAQPRGQGFLLLMQSIWRAEGEQRVRELVEDAAAMLTTVEVRWVQMDVEPGHPSFPHALAVAREAVSTGQIATATLADERGRMYRRSYLPVEPGLTWLLEVNKPLDREQAYVQTSNMMLAGATAVIVAVCGLVAAVIGRRLVGRPLRDLREQAHCMAEGDYSVRLSLRQRDEIGELAEQMNLLCERLAEATRRVDEETAAKLSAYDQLRHSDRLATIGQLASGVAHELGTPLSVASARAHLLASDGALKQDVRENARIVVEQLARMTDIIRQLLDFSRRRRGRPTSADVRALVGNTLELLAALGGRRGVRFELEAPPEPITVDVDEAQLQQALTNIVLNGIQAMPSGGRMRVRIESVRARPPGDREIPEATYRRVEIEDDGQGIAPEHLPHIFEPFFTTKASGEGTGLGLSVAHGIITDHGGWIDVDSAPGHGTRFRVYLPAAAPAGAPLRVAS
jgi:two-component system NtrC family sensor kinase